jgi:hypothetical protein
MDHERVYEEEGLWSWYFVLIIQVTEVWLLWRELWVLIYI